MNSGSSHSFDAPKTYPAITNAQQEQTSIMRSTEIPEASPYASSQGAGERNSSCSKPSRPIGVISPKALKVGTPSPAVL